MKNANRLNFRYVSGVQVFRSKKTDTSTQTSYNEEANEDQWNNAEQDQMFHMMNDELKHLSLDQMQRPLPETWDESDKEHAHFDTIVRCFVKRNSCPTELSAKVDKISVYYFLCRFCCTISLTG